MATNLSRGLRFVAAFACVAVTLGLAADAAAQSYYYGKSSSSPVIYSAKRNTSTKTAGGGCGDCGSTTSSCGSTCGGSCGSTCGSTCGSVCGVCDTCDECGCDECCCDECCCDGPLPYYLAFSGGWSSLDPVVDPALGNTSVIFDDGFAMNAAVGKQFQYFRGEFEYSFFNFDAVSVNVPGLGVFGATTGNANLHAFMFNSYFDMPIGDSRWRVYGGGGLGFAQASINSLLAPGLIAQAANATSGFTFAWQVRTGLNYEVNEQVDLYMGYRYFDTSRFTIAEQNMLGGIFNANGALIHNIEWGIRLKL